MLLFFFPFSYTFDRYLMGLCHSVAFYTVIFYVFLLLFLLYRVNRCFPIGTVPCRRKLSLSYQQDYVK